MYTVADVEGVNEQHADADTDADNEYLRKMCLAADTTEDGNEQQHDVADADDEY